MERSSLQIADEAAEPLSLSKSSAAPGAVLIPHPLTARCSVLGAKLTVSKTISLHVPVRRGQVAPLAPEGDREPERARAVERRLDHLALGQRLELPAEGPLVDVAVRVDRDEGLGARPVRCGHRRPDGDRGDHEGGRSSPPDARAREPHEWRTPCSRRQSPMLRPPGGEASASRTGTRMSSSCPPRIAFRPLLSSVERDRIRRVEAIEQREGGAASLLGGACGEAGRLGGARVDIEARRAVCGGRRIVFGHGVRDFREARLAARTVTPTGEKLPDCRSSYRW